MKLLVLDTSSICQAAVVTTDKVLSMAQVVSMKHHAEEIANVANGALKEAGIAKPDAILVGTGPGPFTGLRVGIATGQAVAFAWNIPLYGLMSHYGFAAGGEFIALSDARRKEFYWSQFKDGRLVDGPQVAKRDTLPDLPTVGFENEPLYTDAGILGVQALTLINDGKDLSDINPYYLREPDAKVPNLKKKVLGGRGKKA
ncbi:MAG: tRNA (adenosine(37)-N6)-threonylcarbamoyltransferase complex dimerization subunit type 1 TsaB [Micrococcaceae bacterium]